MLKQRMDRIARRGAAALGLAAASSLGSTAAQAAPDIKALADKNGCFSCHGMQGKLVGPGFAEVAAKYKGDSEATGKLARKIQEGGKGAWGRIPMPPHPSLKDEEAKQLAAWVLEAG